MSKELLDIQTTIECRFTLKHVRDIVRTYRQLMMLERSNFKDIYPEELELRRGNDNNAEVIVLDLDIKKYHKFQIALFS